MIVFDLQCARDHRFEAWFGSGADYESQKARGLVTCPVCGDGDVGKAVMAPAVGAKSNQRAVSAVPTRISPEGSAPVPMSNMPDPAKMQAMMEALAQAQKAALEDSEWVGRKFADVARSMHYGEEDHRTVHGEVAPDEAKSLMEEGVPVAPLLFPVVPPEAQN
ncbi:MAG: DUF1178 domain-containing protein [Sphingobium sp.]|nr:MAG: DUF1178 domain-containing protein [Sphingobium sp.]